jgi:hypothetical protein
LGQEDILQWTAGLTSPQEATLRFSLVSGQPRQLQGDGPQQTAAAQAICAAGFAAQIATLGQLDGAMLIG